MANIIIIRQQGRLCHIESKIDDKLNNYLNKSLSYTKPGARFLANPFWAKVFLYSIKRQVFPIGLLDKVKTIMEEWKKQNGEDYTIILNPKLQQIPISLDGLRDYQVDAFNAIWKNCGGLLCAATGSGKSLCGKKILEASGNVKKLVLVPSKDLKFQWDEDLKTMKNVRISTYQKIVRELKTEEGKKELNSYDVILGDEIHLCAAKTFYKVLMNCSNAKMVVGMTATATGRSDGEDMKIIAAVGDIVYTIPIQELTAKGYLVPAKVNIINIEKYQVGPMDEYRDIYTNGIVKNKERNEKAVDIAIQESKKGVVLVYIDIIEHGETLLKMFKDKKQKGVIFVHGNVKERKKILQDVVRGKYSIVIGSKIYGTGINVPKFTALVLVGGGRGTIKIIQLSGRMLRLNEGKDIVNIYDFKDDCKNLKTHYQKRIKIYKDLGFDVEE